MYPQGVTGVGASVIGYMFGYYKKIMTEHTGVLTGKGLDYGGALSVQEAMVLRSLFCRRNVSDKSDWPTGKTVAMAAPNVAQFATRRAKPVGRQGRDALRFERNNC